MPESRSPGPAPRRVRGAKCLSKHARWPGRITVLGSLGLALALAAPATPALAQFKWVSADGTISYGDTAPPGARSVIPGATGSAASGVRTISSAGDTAGKPGAAGDSGRPADARLPYELRAVAKRHSVTLYTTAACPPCEQARTHLAQRGVPHEERTVRTSEDARAFTALGFAELSFPALRMGADTLLGFEANAWNRALDAAGYPKTSQLPPHWQFSRARPMTAPSREEPRSATKATAIDPKSIAESVGAADRTLATSSIPGPQRTESRAGELRRSAPPFVSTPTIRF